MHMRFLPHTLDLPATVLYLHPGIDDQYVPLAQLVVELKIIVLSNYYSIPDNGLVTLQ